MRRLLYLLTALAALAFLFPGCKKDSSDPGKVTLKFLTAIQHSNYTEAKKYSTKDSRAMLDALAAFQKMLPESSQEKFKNGKISILEVQKRDTMAVVTYKSDKDSTRKTLKLKKEGNKWKVAFTKETVLPDINKPLNAPDSLMEEQPASPSPSGNPDF